MIDSNLPEWTHFDVAIPRGMRRLLIRLNDGRELKGEKIHTELVFEDVFSGKTHEGHRDLQMKATEWKYI